MPCSARRGGISWLDFRFYKVLGREPPARYRVIKPARVVVSRNSRALSCYKILPLTFPPSQNGPGGALCGVLPCGNIVCRLCAGTHHRGKNRGAVKLVTRRAALSVLCSPPPPQKPANPAGGLLVRVRDIPASGSLCEGVVPRVAVS